MVYFLNTNISENKNINIALKQVFGIGKALSCKICQRLGLSENIKLSKLNFRQMEKISILINNFYFGNSYKQIIQKQKQRLVKISSYRGFRFKQKLPARGQRTHTNAKTAKKTV
jgi:small subunit ribosomal protein S13